jgi:hypothetical protein
VVIEEIHPEERKMTLAPGDSAEEGDWESFAKKEEQSSSILGQKLHKAMEDKKRENHEGSLRLQSFPLAVGSGRCCDSLRVLRGLITALSGSLQGRVEASHAESVLSSSFHH